MAQRLSRRVQPKTREKRRAAAARYFDMTPEELDESLRDPGEARKAIAFALRAIRHLVRDKD